MKKRGIVLCIIVIFYFCIKGISEYFVWDNCLVQANEALSISQAKALALANSHEYKRLKSKIDIKYVAYKEAVKKLQLKKKNMSTFRWSPLLSFTFPTKPDLVDEYEFIYKPLSIRAEISVLEHQLLDQVYIVYEQISNLYTQIYTLQERLIYQEELLDDMQDTYGRNQARLYMGKASSFDLKQMEKSISTLTKTIASQKREFEQKKQKLSELIKIDITSGYTFLDPYIDAFIERDYLDKLIEYTLEKSHACFEAKMAMRMAEVSLDTNYNLMYAQYGNKMNTIEVFIKQVKAGEELDFDIFKEAYNRLLLDVDSPWLGKKKILFIQIPKEWFKGEIDGVRYIEDEPYALYTAALEYQEAGKDYNDTKKEVENQVRDSFESLVTARNSYLSIKGQVEELKESVLKAEYQNIRGELTYGEYKDLEEEYRECQMELLDSLDFYSQLLYSFDRLTCGGATALLSGEFLELQAIAGGNSYLEEEKVEGAYYYIQPKIEDRIFELGIYLPEDYKIEITDFELWCDGIRIGERTPVEKTLRHLVLSKSGIQKVFLRLYQDGTFIDDCEIDAQAYKGELKVVEGYQVIKKEEKRTIAEYQYEKNNDTGIAALILKPYAAEKIGYYKIQDAAGQSLFLDELIPIDSQFSYLSLFLADLEEITVEFYGENQEFLYNGYFDMSTMTVYTE